MQTITTRAEAMAGAYSLIAMSVSACALLIEKGKHNDAVTQLNDLANILREQHAEFVNEPDDEMTEQDRLDIERGYDGDYHED